MKAPQQVIKDTDKKVPEQKGLPIPDETQRPCFVVFEEGITYKGKTLRAGVYYFGADYRSRGGMYGYETWLSSPIHIVAVTHDHRHANFGRLIRIRDSLGKWKKIPIPMELLRGNGEELRGILLNMGAEISLDANKKLLLEYFQSERPPKTILCVSQTGWANGVFVLLDENIGPHPHSVVFQSSEPVYSSVSRSGSLESWQQAIADKAIGNPYLIFAISAAFAGPLLKLVDAENGGVHFVGDSSTGKTTLLEAACSVWGSPEFKRSWRSTSNGMESVAVLQNDCLLALDEISECDPKEVGAIIYALGNGVGKQRARRSGMAKDVSRWRSIVLSSGERSIGSVLTESGNRAKAGQFVRLIDIPVTGKYGVWDSIPEGVSPASYSERLKGSTQKNFGQAGRKFLKGLTNDSRDHRKLLEDVKKFISGDQVETNGQVTRSLSRHALIGYAGELAIQYGVVNWARGSARGAAALMHSKWFASRPDGSAEKNQILGRLRDFIDRHGESRFSPRNEQPPQKKSNDAGFWEDTAEGRKYYFYPYSFVEALGDIERPRAVRMLRELGAIPPVGNDGRDNSVITNNGRSRRCYPITYDKLN